MSGLVLVGGPGGQALVEVGREDVRALLHLFKALVLAKLKVPKHTTVT